jgi:hypothetical protein
MTNGGQAAFNKWQSALGDCKYGREGETCGCAKGATVSDSMAYKYNEDGDSRSMRKRCCKPGQALQGSDAGLTLSHLQELARPTTP